jgi:hypothetical protein
MHEQTKATEANDANLPKLTQQDLLAAVPLRT